jgi:hypothetical protein
MPVPGQELRHFTVEAGETAERAIQPEEGRPASVLGTVSADPAGRGVQTTHRGSERDICRVSR